MRAVILDSLDGVWCFFTKTKDFAKLLAYKVKSVYFQQCTGFANSTLPIRVVLLKFYCSIRSTCWPWHVCNVVVRGYGDRPYMTPNKSARDVSVKGA